MTTALTRISILALVLSLLSCSVLSWTQRHPETLIRIGMTIAEVVRILGEPSPTPKFSANTPGAPVAPDIVEMRYRNNFCVYTRNGQVVALAQCDWTER